MTTHQELVTDLRSIPDQIYIDTLIECKKIYMKYPTEMSFNFIIGEKIEHEFMKRVKPYIDLTFSEKGVGDTDFLYKEVYNLDSKSMKEGLKIKQDGEFYAKKWTLKNPYSNKDVFTTKADAYLLIDPICGRIAVIESSHFTGLNNNRSSTTCKFKLFRNQVDMIFDGTGKIPVVEHISRMSTYEFMENLP